MTDHQGTVLVLKNPEIQDLVPMTEAIDVIEEARTQLTAAAAVRPLKKIKVYSSTKENRERFAKEMSVRTGLEVVPVGTAEEAVRGSDIVTAAINTVEPVVEGHWLEEGTHVN